MTATIAIAADPARLEVGRCVIATLRVLWRRGFTLMLLAAPFVFLPELLAALLPPELATVRLAAGLPGLIFVGGATQITYADLASDRPVGIVEAMSEGAGNFGSLWGVGLISNIGAGLGALLLIVPGVLLLVAWMSRHRRSSSRTRTPSTHSIGPGSCRGVRGGGSPLCSA